MCIVETQPFHCIIIIFNYVLKYLLGFASCVGHTRRASDTVCIMTEILHFCIMVKRALKSRLVSGFDRCRIYCLHYLAPN